MHTIKLSTKLVQFCSIASMLPYLSTLPRSSAKRYMHMLKRNMEWSIYCIYKRHEVHEKPTNEISNHHTWLDKAVVLNLLKTKGKRPNKRHIRRRQNLVLCATTKSFYSKSCNKYRGTNEIFTYLWKNNTYGIRDHKGGVMNIPLAFLDHILGDQPFEEHKYQDE